MSSLFWSLPDRPPAADFTASGDDAIGAMAADPRTRTLLGYWRGMPRAGGLPRRGDIDPGAIAGLLSHVWLMDVAGDESRPQFRYRLLGNAVQTLFPEIRRGRSLGEIYGDVEGSLSELQFKRAMATGEPQWRRGSVLFDPDRMHVRVERLVLPLADDGATVDGFLALTVRLSAEDGVLPEPDDPYRC